MSTSRVAALRHRCSACTCGAERPRFPTSESKNIHVAAPPRTQRRPSRPPSQLRCAAQRCSACTCGAERPRFPTS
eukprot:1038449-Pyramimonas_sp.AAC.1